MSNTFERDLLDLCTGLGGIVEKGESGTLVYCKGDHTTECLKELLRALSEDDPMKRTVFRKLGSWKIVGCNVLPLMVAYRDDFELVYQCLKLIVALTLPILDHKPLPQQAKDIAERKGLMDPHIMAECQMILFEHKQAFLETKDVSNVIFAPFAEALDSKPEERSDADHVLIELILTLYRNLLHIPEARERERKRQLLILQDRVLLHLKKHHVIDTVLYLSKGIAQANREFNFLLTEILSNCFRDEDPEMVVKGAEDYQLEKQEAALFPTGKATGNVVSKDNNSDDDDEQSEVTTLTRSVENPLSSILSDEKKRRERLLKSITGRHSRFGGAYVLKEPGGRRTFLSSQTVAKPSDQHLKVSLPHTQRPFLDPKHRKTINRAKGVYFFLSTMAQKFIAGSFNPLVASILNDYLQKRQAIYATDERYFCLLTSFMLGFHRIREDHQRLTTEHAIDVDMSPVHAALNLSCFKFVFSLCQGHFEEKNYSQLPHTVSLLAEMFRAVKLLSISKNEQNREAADHLIAQVVYNCYDKLVLVGRMLNEFLSPKMSRGHLENLIVLASTTLQLMIRANENMALTISKKKRRRAKKLAEADPEEAEREAFEETEEEQPMDVKNITKLFTSPGLVAALTFLLEDYRSFTEEVSHSICRLIECICDDAKMEPMLYQASFFLVIHRMLEDPDVVKVKGIDVLLPLLATIVNNFIRGAFDHKHLFLDALFWKTRNEVTDILEKIDPMNQNVIRRREKERKQGKRRERDDLDLGEAAEREGAGHVSSSVFSPWTSHEDEILQHTYEQIKDSPFAMKILLGVLLGRTEDQIAARIVAKELEANRASVPSSKIAAPLELGDREKAICKEKLLDRADATVWVFQTLRETLDDSPSSLNDSGITTPSALVPVHECEWEAVKDLRFQQVLCVLGFSPPSPGCCFWSLPEGDGRDGLRKAADFFAAVLEERVTQEPTPTFPMMATDGRILDTPAPARHDREPFHPVSRFVSPFKEQHAEHPIEEREKEPKCGLDQHEDTVEATVRRSSFDQEEEITRKEAEEHESVMW